MTPEVKRSNLWTMPGLTMPCRSSGWLALPAAATSSAVLPVPTPPLPPPLSPSPLGKSPRSTAAAAAAAAAAAEKAADPVVVVSVLSGGVHSPFAAYGTDAELKGSYSITNAANAAGFYNDLGLDAFAKKRENAGVTFVHASPGFVNTNWGTEMPWVIKSAVRVLQVFGRSPAACAEYMCSPMLRYSNAELAKMAERSAGLTTPRKTKAAAAEEAAGSEVDSSSSSGSAFRGVLVLGQDGDQKAVTKLHVPEAREAVWASTREVLSRAGIVL